MDAHLLHEIINKIRADKAYLDERRILHENYEWLEHFWRYKYDRGDQSIDSFITQKAKYYWNKPQIKNFAREFASIECVGSNKKSNSTQNHEIAQATMYLRHNCSLFLEAPKCFDIPCRHHKSDIGLCTINAGRAWNNVDDNNNAAFKALIYIVRQIRNNLFHGHKMTLDNEQFQRDKILVSLAAQITSFLIENLIASGE
jgi:hypothetical protein